MRTVQLIDPAGGVTHAWRDPRGNLEVVQDATGASTHYKSDERGLVTAVTDAVGATTRFAYDRHGNLTEVVLPNGGKWAFSYDSLGRRVAGRDPMGAETRYAYSERGDLLAIHDAAGGVTRYAYDGEQHLTQVVTPAGRVSHFSWGGFHKFCASRDPAGGIVRLAYDREGALVSIRNEREQVHRFRHDTAGRLIAEETFDRRRLSYRRDAAGRVVRVEGSDGRTYELSYDATGQLVSRAFADETSESFEYNARGEVVRATSAAGQFRFERDAVGRIVRESQVVDGQVHWTRTTYDPAGWTVARETSLGHTETITRDGSGSPVTTVLDGFAKLRHAHDLLRREVDRRLPGGDVIADVPSRVRAPEPHPSAPRATRLLHRERTPDERAQDLRATLTARLKSQERLFRRRRSTGYAGSEAQDLALIQAAAITRASTGAGAHNTSLALLVRYLLGARPSAGRAPSRSRQRPGIHRTAGCRGNVGAFETLGGDV